MPPWRRRKPYPGQDWSYRDANLAGLLFVLVVLAGLDERFVYVAVAVAVGLAAGLAVRYVRRRRREREHDRTSEFWADRIER